jgi:anthranilate phosphoribosyltransferase
VLAHAGARLDLPPDAVARCVADCNFGFMFAPNHHPAMRYAAPVRRDLGVRTLFNLLGPLTNPAAAGRMLLGVFHPAWLAPYARTLSQLGCRRALVVHGGGCDEIAVHDETRVAELTADGEISEYTVAPEQFGIQRASLDEIRVASVAESAAMLNAALANADGAPRDAVLLNGGAAIFAAGLTQSLADGIAKAKEVIGSGKARQKLADFAAATRRYAPAA